MSHRHEVERLLEEAERAGFRVCRPNKRGTIRLYPPDGGQVMFCHVTLSDVRGIANLRAHLRRRGLPRSA